MASAAQSQSDPDLPLVQRALAGDYTAFETLVNRYEKRIYALALRITRNDADAQDATQTTLIAMLEKLESFSQASTFASWILRIATNEALVILRKKKVRRAQSLDAPSDASDDSAPLPHPALIARWQHNPEELAANAEVRELINNALDEIDEKYRLVFLLRDVQGLSTEETAQALGLTPANTKVRLLRARLMLREKLTTALGDPATAMKHEHP